MKRKICFSAVCAAFCLMCSCSLIYEDVVLQVMNRSHSGIDLRHKTIASFVIYKDAEDSISCSRAMYDFIEKMSSEYNETISLYALKYSDAVDYTDSRVIAEMLTDVGADVVFLSVPADADEEPLFRVYVYDGMSSEDQVLSTRGFKRDSIFVSSTTNQLLALFGPNWSTGVFRVLLYEGRDDWFDAYVKASKGEWTAAINKWMSILETSQSLDKRAAAEYNIALGCYLTGRLELSDKWLTQAMADCGATESPDYMKNLRVLINKEKSK